ncbi:hypothetical protein IEO21_10936 [Rhodonia placenta]|uniref:Uncharacterized protein n=1 Tax=Rhodonia placenta TaxID=104341 RepID=A0A8H7NRI4_9APHY|nr:hypothetical protein IEO21_10936 [Postia placenta]
MRPSEKETSPVSASAAGRKGTDTSSAPIVRTSLTQNTLTRGLRLPRVPPRRRQAPPSLHPQRVQVPLQRNRTILSWQT